MIEINMCNHPSVPRTAAALLVCACGGDTTVELRGEYETRDSAGVGIIETSGEVARSDLGWTVAPTHDLQIGVSEGEQEYEFDQVRGIAVLADGRISVLDGRSAELRVFDASGNHLSTIGRRGEGPGEFRMPRLVRMPTYDSLLIHDRALARFTTVLSDGTVRVRPAQFEGAAARGNVIGAGAAGELLIEDFVIYMDNDPDAFQPPMPVDFFLASTTTSRNSSPLGTYPGERGFEVPFHVHPSAAVSRSGIFIHSDAHPDIEQYDATGQLRRLIRIREPRQRVTDETLELYIQHYIASRHSTPAGEARSRERFASMPLPEVVPMFTKLLVDSEGLLWARSFSYQSGPRQWIVFDTAGRALGSVAIPESLDVHQIGRDFVAGLWQDENNVSYVRRHRLSRNATALQSTDLR